MNADKALQVADQVLSVAINLLLELQLVSDFIRQARAEGRDLTDAEMQRIKDNRDASLKALEDALKP
jgi:cell division protein ZapA (FtsZ GTPase activity inhibitor)